jgi:hypothetical protein
MAAEEELMRIPKFHRPATDPTTPATPRRHRTRIMLGAGTLVVVLGTTGIVTALAGRSPTAKQTLRPPATVAKPATVASTPPAAPPSPSSQEASGSGSSLADGTYPTYVRGVDVHGATITVDVIQVFQDEAAVKAAMEDGKTLDEAQYLYVYIRNQSSRLRTLPVATDVRIEFVGTCESPPDRNAALTELAKKTTPFDKTYYYDITVAGGAINRIAQHLAIPAC